MSKYLAIITSFHFLLFSALCISKDMNYSINDVQGGWWSSCDAPAVEFYIRDDNYSGDFLGEYKVEISDNILIFKSGLIDGHSINLSGKPLSFRILNLNKGVLYLERNTDKGIGRVWQLYSCL